MHNHTFLWHDYETFGAQPRRDRPAQFAAIRTDAELQEVGEPIMLYCQPANDYLPDPTACLITGITPQQCLREGIPEYQFANLIEKAFSQKGTIGVGYNTIRFDDEVTRFLLWRNLRDPYAREWQNECGRWDILDLVRTAWALRPDGIVWPVNDEGKTSFRLEHLSAANGIGHTSAHDALSDVRATIGLARLLRERQPRLFDFCLALHKKDRVAQELNLHLPLAERKPVLHISGMYGVERGCMALVFPLAMHPQNKNEVIVWDCSFDPHDIFDLLQAQDVEAIRRRMFSKSEDLVDESRLPLKTIHINKSPIVISQLKTLSAEQAAKFGIDVALAQQHATLCAQLSNPAQANVWEQVFARDKLEGQDVDEDLYGGFVGREDRQQLQSLLALPAPKLAQARFHFHDPRLEELLFRYRARNFPDSLNEDEAMQWEDHRMARLLDGANGARNIDMLFAELDQLQANATPEQQTLLEALYEYAEMIVPQ